MLLLDQDFQKCAELEHYYLKLPQNVLKLVEIKKAQNTIKKKN